MRDTPDPKTDAEPAQSPARGFSPESIVTGVFLGAIGIGIAALVFGYASLDLDWQYWGEHKVIADGTEALTFDRSTIFRNFGLATLALIGLGLATWRSYLALQQTKTGLRQAETANKQAETANEQARIANIQAENAIAQRKLSESGLIIDRYQKGALMLESDELSVRNAGVFALRELALSDPDETYFLVLELLYAFVREKSKTRPRLGSNLLDYATKAGPDEFEPFEADMQHALQAASHLRNTLDNDDNREQRGVWWTDLRDTNLSNADLSFANLSGANLFLANLSGARLFDANLSGARLNHTNLSGAVLYIANLSEAKLSYANLSNADLLAANLSDASLNNTNLSDADLKEANLSGAKLEHANLSGAELTNAKLDDETQLLLIWAFEDAPPQNMPDRIAKAIAYRKRGEDWDDFKDRVLRDREV